MAQFYSIDNCMPSHFMVHCPNVADFQASTFIPPNISLIDYHLSKGFELSICNRRFFYTEEVIKGFQQFIKAKNEDFFLKCINSDIDKLYWNKAVEQNGYYFD